MAFYPRRRYNKKPKTGGNKPVARALSKYKPAPKKPAPKYVVANNRLAIRTLARQVKALQVSKLGLFQKNFEFVKLDNVDGQWHDHAPYCFPLNNFLKDQCRIFQATEDTSTHPGYTIPGHVVRKTFTQWTPTSPVLTDEFNYWAGANEDQASFIAYKPISTNITFKFTSPALPPNVNYWVRIDIIKPTKTLMQTNVKSLNLPKNLLSLGNLAHSDMERRNKINKMYFQTCLTKWINLKNTKNSTNTTTERYCKINWKFSKSRKSGCETLDAGVVIDTATGPITTTFEDQMPKDDIYWVVLSTSNQSGDPNRIEVDMNRTIAYRDQHGVAS